MRKRTAETALRNFIIYPLKFTALLVYYHENYLYNHGNLYIITKTHRQFPCLYKGFACEYRLLRDSIRVSVIISDFCLRVYTIRQKNPRTTIRTLTNVKMPLKAHGNNVILKPM